MASIEGRAQLHIKEDGLITLITTKDAITDIIALLCWFCFAHLEKLSKERRKSCSFFCMWTVTVQFLKMLLNQLVLILKLGPHSYDLLFKVNIFNKG